MGELVPVRGGPAVAGGGQAVAATAARGLCWFAQARGIPPGREFLLDYDVIEAFCVAGLPGRAPSTRGTYRSALYRSALALALVVFGIGAGLRPGELVALRGGDVTRHGRQVVVHVSGPAARVVPVTADYAGRAWELAGRAGSDFVFRPGPAERGYKNFVTNFALGLAADPAAPRLSLRRARSSFICGQLAAGTPVGVLLDVTGIAEAGSLAATPATWRASAHPRVSCASAGARRTRGERRRPDPAVGRRRHQRPDGGLRRRAD